MLEWQVRLLTLVVAFVAVTARNHQRIQLELVAAETTCDVCRRASSFS